MKTKIRPLTETEVRMSIDAEPEHSTPDFEQEDGSADTELIHQVLKRLEDGNEWAWCVVRVTMSWGEWKGVAYLGGCSCDSLEEFIENGDYYQDLKKDALSELNARIGDSYRMIEGLLVQP